MANCAHLSPKDHAEAATVTGRGDGHQFEIQLGHLCNDRCVFCSSGQLTQMKIARHIPLDPIIAAIEAARAGGAKRITFLGGEPTLHKGFLAAVKRCVELGFESVVIFTNGVLLPHPGFVESVVALGKFEWRISIQGANEAAHVAVTGRKDSFRRIIQGLEKLRTFGQDVTANLCVNERSYKSLPEYPVLVREYGIRQLHVDIVRPSSTGERTEEYLRDIMPRYSVMAPYFREMLGTFEREDPSYDVNIGNLPFCILPDFAHRINHGGEETFTAAAGGDSLQVAVDKYAWHESMRRHVPACENCAFRSHCTGIFSTYLDMYGADEFRSVSLDDLKGTESRNFVIIAEPRLAKLKAAPPPDGWRVAEWIADRRGNQIQVRFRDAREGKVELKFAPQPALAIAADPEVAPADLERLLSWARDLIPAAIDIPAHLAAHRQLRLIATGQARVNELIGRIALGSWTLGERSDGPQGSVVQLQGPSGGLVELIFTIRTDGDRPQVTLDARVGQGTNAAVAQTALARFIREMRASP